MDSSQEIAANKDSLAGRCLSGYLAGQQGLAAESGSIVIISELQ